ncbi:MAG: DPP IV N-terminal domain-containing protein [Actinomycetota bacterium]
MAPPHTPVVTRLLAAVLLVMSALFLAACGGESTARPDLAFVSTRDGDYAIYEMNADGGGEHRVNDAELDSSELKVLFFEIEPAWSPDGTKIAFSSRRSGSFDVYVMNADGTGTQRLTSTKDHDSHPTWSPDGTQIAFARSGDVYVMNADGSDAHRISDPTAEESEPAWSPDGSWIAYIRRTPGGSVQDAWLMRSDGSERRAVTSQRARTFTPAWSPDSTRIVFTSNKDRDVFELYTIGIDGKGLRSVVPTVADNFEPSWSPDGSKIAYQEDGAVFTVELGGGNVEKLTDNVNNDSSPAWNPKPPAEDG